MNECKCVLYVNRGIKDQDLTITIIINKRLVYFENFRKKTNIKLYML